MHTSGPTGLRDLSRKNSSIVGACRSDMFCPNRQTDVKNIEFSKFKMADGFPPKNVTVADVTIDC